ncbi:MAG: hypothetical protein KDE51_15895 [Anaerolineales bacterium]|nr:hypothetical protein [Anaerolineales bacterium]
MIALHDKIGRQYKGCYLYGSLAQGFYQSEQSDINLLVIVEDGTNIHPIRKAFLPIWEKYSDVLVTPPGVATKSAFQRHLELTPLMAHHINKHGKQVQGTTRAVRRTSSLDQRAAVGHLSAQILEASNALLPDIIFTEEGKTKALALLRQLVRQLRRGPVELTEEPLDLYLELQVHLQERIAELEIQVPAAEEDTEPPYHLPELYTVYEKMDQLILAVNDINVLKAFDLDSLQAQADGLFGGVQIGTPEQLMLAVEYDNPLEHLLRSYRHQWGVDLLQTMEPPISRSLQHAARFTSNILIFDLPQAYLTAADDKDIHKVIHDFQNKLLNARLQNELLGRLQVVEKSEPDNPLPERTAPLPQRISAIFKHLEWWTNYYAQAMNSALESS